MGKYSLSTLVGDYTSYCVHEHFQLLFLLSKLESFPVSAAWLSLSLTHAHTPTPHTRSTQLSISPPSWCVEHSVSIAVNKRKILI